MTTKADFSADEWQQVVAGMFLAGVAVSAADPSGLWGMLKESFARRTNTSGGKIDGRRQHTRESHHC